MSLDSLNVIDMDNIHIINNNMYLNFSDYYLNAGDYNLNIMFKLYNTGKSNYYAINKYTNIKEIIKSIKNKIQQNFNIENFEIFSIDYNNNKIIVLNYNNKKFRNADDFILFYGNCFYIQNIKDTIDCPICFELCCNSINPFVCNHQFCNNCINSYSAISTTISCPLCRSPLYY